MQPVLCGRGPSIKSEARSAHWFKACSRFIAKPHFAPDSSALSGLSGCCRPGQDPGPTHLFLSEASALTTPERRRGTAPPRSETSQIRREVFDFQKLGGTLSGRLRSPVRNPWSCLDTHATVRGAAFETPVLEPGRFQSFGKAARNAAMCGSADAPRTLPAPLTVRSLRAPACCSHCGSWLGPPSQPQGSGTCRPTDPLLHHR